MGYIEPISERREEMKEKGEERERGGEGRGGRRTPI